MAMAQLPTNSEESLWTMGEEYVDEYRVRMHFVNSTFNQDALLDHASSLREDKGITCQIDEDFAVGNLNLVKRVVFEDGIAWIARLRMPQIELFDKDGLKDDLYDRHDRRLERFRFQQPERTRYEMECEIDTMEFVRSRTNIPIPKVFAANFDDGNAVGFPYSLMEYVEGNTATELAAKLPGDHEGIPDQFVDKFMGQVARVMFELANIRMPRIGSIHRAADNGFEVDKLVDVYAGPYDNAVEFYNSYPTELANSVYGEEWRDYGHAVRLLHAFRQLNTTEALTVPDAGDNDDYGLANYDLGPHNFLVDREFNVLAVIDWDAVFAVPDPVLYRVPYLMGAAPAVPGIVETHPACKARGKLFLRFAEIVDRTSKELAQRSESPSITLLTKEGFCSKKAVAFRALVHFQQKQDWVDEEWIKGLNWLASQSAQDVLDFYFRDG